MSDLPSGPLISYGKLITIVTGADGMSASRVGEILGRIIVFHLVLAAVLYYVVGLEAFVTMLLLAFAVSVRYASYLAAYQQQLIETLQDEFPDAEIIEI